MEEKVRTGRGKNVAMLLMILIILGLGSYIVYDKVIKGNEKKETTETKQNENKKEEEPTVPTPTYDYYLSFDVNASRDPYLLSCEGKNCTFVTELEDYYYDIDMYKDRFYFETAVKDTLYIKYIDLKDDLKIKTWLSYKDKEYNAMYPLEFISDYVIIDDVMYFNFSSSPSNIENGDGLLSMSMNATNFTDFKVIDPNLDMGRWVVDKNNKVIYYLNFYYNDPAAYKYDIKTGKKEKMFTIKGASGDLLFVQGHLLYFDDSKSIVYDVDLNTFKQTEFLKYSTITGNKAPSFLSNYQAYQDKLYLRKDSSVYKYDFDTNKYEKILDISSPKNYNGFHVYDNAIEIYQDKEPYTLYYVDGKFVDKLPEDFIEVDVKGKQEKIDFNSLKKLVVED